MKPDEIRAKFSMGADSYNTLMVQALAAEALGEIAAQVAELNELLRSVANSVLPLKG